MSTAKKVLKAFKYAIEGFFTALKTERNMKIHLSIMFWVILMGFIFKLSFLEWIICIILFVLVISGELFNTAIEIMVDRLMPYENENAKKAKDISAAAVLVLAIGAAVIGLMIFIPKIG